MDFCSLMGFHLWSKWSEPVGSVDGSNPSTALWYQSRNCSQCNLAEFRKVDMS